MACHQPRASVGASPLARPARRAHPARGYRPKVDPNPNPSHRGPQDATHRSAQPFELAPVQAVRVLYVAVYDPHLPLSGAGTRGFQVVRGLADRFALDLVCMEGSGQYPPERIPDAYRQPIKGVRRTARVPFSPFGYFVYSKRLHRAAARWAASTRYHAVICDFGLSALYGLRLARSHDLPLIYLSHNVEHRMAIKKLRQDPRRLPLALHNFWVERLAIRRAVLTVAISDADAEFFTRWTDADRLCVIPQGFDEQVFHPPANRQRTVRPVVLFCGNFRIQFNLAVVRQAMEGGIVDAVATEHPDVLFRFVGAHPPTDVQHPNVEFTGFVEDYPAYLRAADVVMTPMLQGGGFPTKVIEALACGKHVVATPVGARAVDPSYETLHVTPLEDFPRVISGLLREGRATDSVDYDRLRAHYSWTALVGRLGDRIETALSDP